MTAGDARGDRIVVRGGGQIVGKVSPDPKDPDRVSVLTERGKTPLSLRKAQVLQVIAEPGPLDEYLTKRAATAETAEAQYDLGEWCERHTLSDLADTHYEAALRLDKTFAPAHRKRGHVYYEGRWLTRDEHREALGLIRSRGRWITPEEKARREKAAANIAEQSVWHKRVVGLRQAMAYGTEGRRHEAESQLLEIRDPAAVAPLVRVLSGDPSPGVRTLLAHALGSIPGPEATAALALRLLDEAEAEVRFAVLDELIRRDDTGVTTVLLKGLRASAPEVVNRAAWGLSGLNAVSTVPKLVPALITARYEVVLASSGGGDGSANPSTFGSVPASASGASAYGSSPLPLPNSGYGPSAAGIGVSAGGGAPATRGPFPRLVRVTYRNPQVLAALVKMTGQDFGYDVDAWRAWVRTSFNPEPAPSRRVPQP